MNQMEINISNKKETYVLALVVALIGFAVAFVAAPFILQAVNGQPLPPPPTADQERIGKDDNGNKLEYNECPGYDNGVDPSDYEFMTLEELGQLTIDVDTRISELKALGSSIGNDEKRELNCLEAVRAIENYAEKVKMPQATNDMIEGIEALQKLSELGVFN